MTTFCRSWWQLNGCVGVPLYKIYRRSTEWRSEMPPLPAEEPEDADPEMALLTTRYASSRLSKADSVEELMKSYYSDCGGTAKSRAAAATTTKSGSSGEATATGDSEEADSGRSTPGETNLSLVRPVEKCEISLAPNIVLCRIADF